MIRNHLVPDLKDLYYTKNMYFSMNLWIISIQIKASETKDIYYNTQYDERKKQS